MIRGNMKNMTAPEAEAALTGLVERNVLQFQQGAPSFFQALMNGDIKYQRGDTDEHWKSVNELHESGYGDCEDLAAALAAEYVITGRPARVRVTRSGQRMFHAWTQTEGTVGGRTVPIKQDPSVWGGMRGPWSPSNRTVLKRV